MPKTGHRIFRFQRAPGGIDVRPSSVRMTCYLHETERSWAPINHKKFTMTTTYFDQLQLADHWGLSPKTLER